MALLLLVRHALTDATGSRLSGNTPGVHLSERGRAQADHLARRLASIPVTSLFSSPLERCLETAAAIADGRGLEVHRLPALVEVGYGRWTGRPLAQLARTTLWKQVQGSPSSVRFPEGETLREVQERAVAALHELAARRPHGTVVAVTHADVIRLVLAHFAGVHLDLFQRLIVSPASVSAVVLGDRIPRVLRMNDTGTLEDLVSMRRRRRAAPSDPDSRPRGSPPVDRDS
jgi:probable phosphomutase (TIGR03848 family)